MLAAHLPRAAPFDFPMPKSSNYLECFSRMFRSCLQGRLASMSGKVECPLIMLQRIDNCDFD